MLANSRLIRCNMYLYPGRSWLRFVYKLLIRIPNARSRANGFPEMCSSSQVVEVCDEADGERALAR
jgi:hypothetical protein